MSRCDRFRSRSVVGRPARGIPILIRMSRRTLKLGAVLLGVGGPGQHETWLSPEIPGDASVDIRWYIARAQQAEAAKFDHVFIVDSQFITPDSPNHYLN